MKASDVYLDQVQAAVEEHPTWDAEQTLLHVFKKWTGLHAEDFMLGIKEDMQKVANATPRHPFENRNA